MAIYNEDIIDVELTGGNIARSFMKKTIGEGDALANRFGIRAYRNGVAENLGGTCLGLFIRADGGTLPVEGVVSGNEAYVELPQACYAVEGQFALSIKVINGNATGTLRIVDGVVDNTTTGSTVDPGTVIPSIEALIAEIEAAIASIPADYSSLWAILAPAYSTSSTYAVGQYVTYNGGFYRCTTAITTPESWTSGHWTAANIGPDVYDLKSDLCNNINSIFGRSKSLVEYDFQYLNPNEAESHYIWGYDNGVFVKTSNNDNKIWKALSVPAGTYKYGVYKQWWSFIRNLLTGEVKTFHDLGLTDQTAGSITIDYPHDVYITSSINSEDVYWFSGTTLSSYDYGVHNAVYHTDSTLSKTGQIADAKVTGDKIKSIKKSSLYCSETIRDGIGKRWQFASHDSSDWNLGYIWTNTGELEANASYACTKICGFPAGTYWINHYSSWQTYIENIETGEFTSFGTLGYTTANTLISLTINYDFNIYITIYRNGSNIEPNFEFFSNFNPSTLPIGMTNVNAIAIGYGAFDDIHIFHVGADKEFTTLKAGIEAAEEFMDSILYVDAGVYDLIDEFGASYFSNFSGSGSYLDGAWGIVLKNRIHIIFAENASVICHYTGNNQNVATYFSAFNAGRYGFTLENANINTSGIRYAVHDDRGNADEEGYSNKYLRCRIKHNKVGTQVTGMDQAIGGGFGNNGDILIESCYLEAVGYQMPVSYHNSANGGTGYKAHCVLTGCYIVGGPRFNDTGASTDVTDVYVSNNSISYGIQHGKTTPEAKDNVAVYEWNNVMRN